MNSDRWRQIDELFDAVLDLPEAERESYLFSRCSGDEALKQEIRSLLKAQSAAGKFMESPALNIAAQSLANQQTVAMQTNLFNRLIGTYKVANLLGAGGMGEVYLAADEKLKRSIALKVLSAHYAACDERIKRFELEAHAVSLLNHPNIVTIFDVGQHDGINYIATEFVEGKSLRELIGSGLKIPEVLNIIIQVCEALSAAHKAGIIHRDIKPENIMVRPDGYVKVLDFGLAKLSDTSLSQTNDFANTAHGIIVGTPAYMSPAQISGDEVDYRTDLWSVGVVLYELLTGVNPFRKDARQATFQAVLNAEPPLARTLNREISPELERILIKALKKDATAGYQTAVDFRTDLRRVRREYDAPTSSEANRPTSLKERKNQSLSFFSLPFLLIFFVALLAVGVGFWLNTQTVEGTNWSAATNVQLTDQAGVEYFPALAPDGKSFVFAANQTGNFDIYIQRVGGKNPQNLTADSSADDTQPAFSPNGELIAFRSEREPKGIYVMGATGENLRRVSDFGYHPSWSPDGREIAVSTFGADQPTVRSNLENGIWIISLESGAKRELSKLHGSFPAWSPNGKHIAFWFYPTVGGRRDIAIVSPSTGKETVVTSDFADSNWNPVWSPDNKFLYFISDRSGNPNFWRVGINAETGAVLSPPEPVVTPSKYSRHLNFSRDGRRMIYVQSDNQANIQAVEFNAKTGKISGAPFWVTRGDREVTRAELSTDGKQFLMRQIRRTQDDIVIFNRDSGAWLDVTNDAAFDRYPRWSPDGKQIAFVSDRSGNYEIWLCNADGTNLRQITFVGQSSTGTSFPIWSPDGKKLIYSVNAQSYLINLTQSWTEQTPQKIPQPENGKTFVAWDWSPDGKKLAGIFSAGVRTIGFFSFETNDFKELTEAPGVIPSWLPDSRALVYASKNKIFLAHIETAQVKELLAAENDQPRSPFVSRDGRLLYYTLHSNESDIWLLDTVKSE